MEPIKPNPTTALLALYLPEKPAPSPGLFAAWIKRLFVFFILSLMVVEQSAWATCTQVSSTCIDTTPCKTISGYQVCLAGVPGGSYNIPQSCWNYQNNYSCDSLNINTCGSVPNTCSNTSATCAQTDPTSGNCILYTRNYTCQNITGAPSPNNTCGAVPAGYIKTGQVCAQTDTYPMVYTDPVYGALEATSDGFIPSNGTMVPTYLLSPNPNYNTCLSYSNNYSFSSNPGAVYGQACSPLPSTDLTGCTVTSSSCASYNAQGICAAYTNNETCTVITNSGTCGAAPAGCTLTSAPCVQTNPVTGACMLYNQNYVCQNVVGAPTTTNTCTQEPANCVKTGQVCAQTDTFPMLYTDPVYGMFEATASGSVPDLGRTVPVSSLVPNPSYNTCLSYSDAYSCSTASTSTGNQSCNPVPASDLTNCSTTSSTCTKTNPDGTCAAYSNNETCTVAVKTEICGAVPTGCKVTGQSCAQTDPVTGTCATYTNNFICQNLFNAPVPVNNCASEPANCTKVGQTCVLSDTYPMVYTDPAYGALEATSAGNVPALGINVSPALLTSNPNMGACITYNDNYSCSTPSTTQSCNPVPQSNLGSCTTTSTTCTATNANGVCTSYTQQKSCGISSSYTSRTGISNTSTQGSNCNTIPSNCVLQTQNCLDTPPGPISSCNTVENVYSCPGTTSPPVTTCTNSICVGQSCYGKTDPANTSLAPAATALEMARQLGSNFNQSSMTLFYGEYHDCSVELGGLFGNCCQVKSSPQPAGSNLQAMVSIGAQYGIASLGAQYGSAYTFDTLMSSSSFASDALSGLGGTGVASASFAGMSVTAGPGGLAFSVDAGSLANFIGVIGNMALMMGAITPAQNLAVQVGSDYAAYALGAMSGVGLAVAVAMAVMQYLSTCSNEENQVAVLRGKGICHATGSWCSVQVPLIGLCLETKQSFCCFNSKLALLVNEQGRPQIGKSWGSAQSPDCSGFSVAQIGLLNFSAMNLSAAFADMMSSVNMPSQSAMMAQANSKISAFYSTLSPGSGGTANQTQLAALATPVVSTAPVNPNTVGTIPAVPNTPAAACTAIWGAKTPDTLTPPDYTSSVNISSCVPNATLDMYYTGACPALMSGFPLHFVFDATGAATTSVSMPASCLPWPGSPATPTSPATPALPGYANSWGGTVVTGGNFSSKVGITW